MFASTVVDAFMGVRDGVDELLEIAERRAGAQHRHWP